MSAPIRTPPLRDLASPSGDRRMKLSRNWSVGALLVGACLAVMPESFGFG
jgi:hypothetical protein